MSDEPTCSETILGDDEVQMADKFSSSPSNSDDSMSLNFNMSDEPTCSETILGDDEVQTADKLPSSPSNSDDCMALNFNDSPALDEPTTDPFCSTIPYTTTASSSMPSLSTTDGDLFKAPYPVKSPTRVSAHSDFRSAQYSNTYHVSSKKSANSTDHVNYTCDVNSSNPEDLCSNSDELLDGHYEDSKVSAHFLVDNFTEDQKDEFGEMSPPYLKRRRKPETKPRKKRTPKEDMPLSERIAHRRYNHLRKVKEKRKEPIVEQHAADDDPWTEEEKMNLYGGLKKHGHTDTSVLRYYVPTRSEQQIQKFILYQTRLAKSKEVYRKVKPKTNSVFMVGRVRPGCSSDVAVHFRQVPGSLFNKGEDFQFWTHLLSDINENMLPDYLTERRDLYQAIYRQAALGHALYLIHEYELHPPVSDTGGVDIKAAYKFLWCCFTRQPEPRLNRATCQFINDQYEQLRASSSLNLGLVDFMDRFKGVINDCCSTKRSKKRGQSSSIHAEATQEKVQDKEKEDNNEDDEDDDSEEEEEEEDIAGEGIEVVDQDMPLNKRRRGYWKPFNTQKGETKLCVFRHPREGVIATPDPCLPSTLNDILKTAVFNPLSIPLASLKNENR